MPPIEHVALIMQNIFTWETFCHGSNSQWNYNFILTKAGRLLNFSFLWSRNITMAITAITIITVMTTAAATTILTKQNIALQSRFWYASNDFTLNEKMPVHKIVNCPNICIVRVNSSNAMTLRS